MDFNVILKNIPYLTKGLILTLELAIISISFSFIIGSIAGLGRISRRVYIRYPSILYIELVRGIPLIMVIFWFFFLLPILSGKPIGSFWSAALALTVFTGAYIAEIVRAGIQSIPKGQTEAALSTGLSNFQVMWFIVIPQAYRNMVPALVSQFIALFKDTSLAYIIGVIELTRASVIINNREFRSFEIFTFVAIIYFIFCYGLSHVSRKLELRAS